ncbi:MAG: hypothetical protein AAF222_11305 [Pseudomonadota bacterium]
MTQQVFSRLTALDGVYMARHGKLHSMAFGLRDGSLCLYSPVAGLERSGLESLSEFGKVSALLAPNHYHNKGLKGHADALPKASLVCSDAAEPRLKKVTGLAFQPLGTLAPRLAQNHRFLQPEGLKTGEVWVQIETAAEVAWMVTDAFSAGVHPPGVWTETPEMLGTFPRYGVKDTSIFKDWVREHVAEARPTILLSCHGSPVRAPDLGARLVGLLENSL